MDSIRQALGQLEQELRSKEQEVARLKAGVAALREILGGAPATAATQVSASGSSSTAGAARAQENDEATISPPATPAPDSPRGREAVRAILEENLGEWVDIGVLTKQIVARGWVSSARPREAVRTSADRLVEDDPLVDKGRGIYRLRDEHGDRLDLDGETQEGGEELEDART